MGLKINGSTSGSIELDVPAAVGSDVTGVLLPSAAGTLDRLERAGNILQVVNGSTDTEVTISTTAMTDTGLSASITPSSTSSRILIFVNQMYELNRTGSVFGGINVVRDSTNIYTTLRNTGGGFEFGYNSSSATGAAQFHGRATFIFLDSPSTTSSVTYKTQGAPNSTSGSGLIMFQTNGTSSNARSYITLVEVAV